MTLANPKVTARNHARMPEQYAIFLNQAHLVGSNDITVDGVLQVMDRLLDPSNPNAAPSTADINQALGLLTTNPSKGLTEATINGIIIAVPGHSSGVVSDCRRSTRMLKER